MLNFLRERLHIDTLTAFHITYWILGGMTILSGMYFLRLKPEDGRGLY